MTDPETTLFSLKAYEHGLEEKKKQLKKDGLASILALDATLKNQWQKEIAKAHAEGEKIIAKKKEEALRKSSRDAVLYKKASLQMKKLYEKNKSKAVQVMFQALTEDTPR